MTYLEEMMAAVAAENWQLVFDLLGQHEAAHHTEADFISVKAMAYLATGDTAQAIATLLAGERLYPADGDIAYNLGFAYLQAGEAGKALAYYEAARRQLEDPGIQAELDETIRTLREQVEAKPGISAVVVFENGLAINRLCVEKLLTSSLGGPLSFIAVDNATTDGTSQFLQSVPNIQYIHSDTPLPLAMALNRGIAKANPADDLLLTTGDCIFLLSSTLADLQQHLYSSPGVGVVSAVSNAKFSGQAIDVEYENQKEAVLRATDNRLANKERRKERLFVAMFCSLIKNDTWQTVGPLDETLAAYFDTDYCLRLRKAGYSLLSCFDCMVHLNTPGVYPQYMVHKFIDSPKEQRAFEAKWGADPGWFEEEDPVAVVLAKRNVLPGQTVGIVNCHGGGTLLNLKTELPEDVAIQGFTADPHFFVGDVAEKLSMHLFSDNNDLAPYLAPGQMVFYFAEQDDDETRYRTVDFILDHIMPGGLLIVRHRFGTLQKQDFYKNTSLNEKAFRIDFYENLYLSFYFEGWALDAVFDHSIRTASYEYAIVRSSGEMNLTVTNEKDLAKKDLRFMYKKEDPHSLVLLWLRLEFSVDKDSTIQALTTALESGELSYSELATCAANYSLDKTQSQLLLLQHFAAYQKGPSHE